MSGNNDDTGRLIDAISIFHSWEDGDANRYFPIGNGRALVRDGCYGTWRGIVEIEPSDFGEAQTRAAE